MRSPEQPQSEPDPRLEAILSQYGDIPVINHLGQPQPLAQAVAECPPFAHVLLGAESPEQLEQIIDSQKVQE